MKIIKITADNKIFVAEFIENSSYIETNRALRKSIGQRCEIYERILPIRLYTDLKGAVRPNRKKGGAVCMLCDGDAYYHNLPINAVGSFLNRTDHGEKKICGDVLIVGQYKAPGGVKVSGLSNNQFNLLFPQLEELTKQFSCTQTDKGEMK